MESPAVEIHISVVIAEEEEQPHFTALLCCTGDKIQRTC